MSVAGAEERGSIRRSSTPDGQLVPSKVLGASTVYVEALDAEGGVVVEKVESEVALLWPFVQKEVVLNKRGKSPETPVQLPKQVGQDILALLLEYCRYHRFPGRSDKERKLFDEKFIRLDTRRLCELTSAADSLDMKPLVDLSSRALARMIEGKTPEEIRETFHLPDDLTEEEKLEPVRNLADDPRIRLLNRLYAKKRKELADKKAELLRKENGHQDPTPISQDTRSVEELLNFIEEERQQGQTKARAKKKKSKKKRDVSRDFGGDSASPDVMTPGKERSSSSILQQPLSAEEERLLADAVENSLENGDAGVDDADLDDEIEAFKRSLNADWEDRRAELILMAGAYQSRPTRVTTLTSLSNFRVKPRDASQSDGPEAEDFASSGPISAANETEMPSSQDEASSMPGGGQAQALAESTISDLPPEVNCASPQRPEKVNGSSDDVSTSVSQPLLRGNGVNSASGQDNRVEEPPPALTGYSPLSEPTSSGREVKQQSSGSHQQAAHRKAIPPQAETSKQSPPRTSAETHDANISLASDGPELLASLFREFAEGLGYSSCVRIEAVQDAIPLEAPYHEPLHCERLLPEVGLVRLQRLSDQMNGKAD